MLSLYALAHNASFDGRFRKRKVRKTKLLDFVRDRLVRWGHAKQLLFREPFGEHFSGCCLIGIGAEQYRQIKLIINCIHHQMDRNVNIGLLLVPFFTVMDMVAWHNFYSECALSGIESVVAISAFRKVGGHRCAKDNFYKLRPMRFADNLP